MAANRDFEQYFITMKGPSPAAPTVTVEPREGPLEVPVEEVVAWLNKNQEENQIHLVLSTNHTCNRELFVEMLMDAKELADAKALEED